MATNEPESQTEWVELRQQAQYWRAQHTRAVEREAVLREKIRHLDGVVKRQEGLIKEQAGKIEAFEAKVVLLQKQVFGKKSEKTRKASAEGRDDKEEGQESNATDSGEKRNRGQQPGTQGHGRKRREDLPTEEVIHDLLASKRCCPICKKPFKGFSGTEDSDEIHWEVRLFRRVHRRKRYVPDCDCGAHPGIVTAPSPAKLVPKGLFSTGFWVNLLLEKFLFQRPLHRIRQVLALEGLSVSQGTLTGGLKRIGELIQPLYAAILEKNREADHWHMDETRWMVFADLAGKAGHRWWLWVVVTRETCAFILDPSRSAKVPKEHLGVTAEGILSVDRYSAYKAYEALGENVRLAFCWSHVRRDFQRVGKGYKKLREWADAWETLINDLFMLNKERLAVRSKQKAFREKEMALKSTLATMVEQMEAELSDPDSLHEAQRKALKSLQNHWDGLTIFVDNPDIPMDNNEAERSLRNPVVGRKNYYGNGSIWSGTLTAMLFTLFQTLLKNGIDPKKALLSYFEVCAENGGRVPENPEAFLPWNLTADRKAGMLLPEKPP
jgi:transposase